MTMKILKMMLIILVLCSFGVVALSCGSESSSTVEQNQLATVQRGNITVEITASGNLALSVTEDLAFEMAGTVEEVLVEDGESVEEGQVLAKLDTSEWETELVTLERSLLEAQISLDNAKLALEQAEGETTTTTTGDIVTTTTDPEEIEILELQVELAEARYEDAEGALEEALNASPEVIAPFAGFITIVNVKGGDEVKKGTVAVTLADPNKFEAEILVSEMDIYQVEVGGAATVEADAFSGWTFPAKVTHISPTATIQSGVVNYSVTVEVQSLEPITSAQPASPPTGTAPPEGFTLPEGATPPEGFTLPEGFTPPTGQGGAASSSTTTVPENLELRQGLTVTVSLIVQQATDVLLVPYAAISTEGGQSYVQVMLSDGTIEKRAITTGITDYVNTEVTEGLSEGEQVVVSSTSSTSTSETSQDEGEMPGGEIIIPGVGQGGPPGQ
jgi:RND family efflux transporter MFP subunit